MISLGIELGPPSWEAGDLFLILDCEAIGTAATPGLLCQRRVIVKMIVEKQMECRLAGRGNRSSRRENLPQRHFCPSQNPTWPDSGLNPGRRGWKQATNHLSYGAALILDLGRGGWSASCPGRFIPGERAPGTHWLEVSVGLRAGRDVLD
jgi:hypothetical protein